VFSGLPSQTGKLDSYIAVEDDGVGTVRFDDRLALAQSLNARISQKLFQTLVIVPNLRWHLRLPLFRRPIVGSVQQTTPNRFDYRRFASLGETGHGKKEAGPQQKCSEATITGTYVPRTDDRISIRNQCVRSSSAGTFSRPSNLIMVIPFRDSTVALTFGSIVVVFRTCAT